MKNFKIFFSLALLTSLTLMSCKKEKVDPKPEDKTTNSLLYGIWNQDKISYTYVVSGQELVTDSPTPGVQYDITTSSFITLANGVPASGNPIPYVATATTIKFNNDPNDIWNIVTLTSNSFVFSKMNSSGTLIKKHFSR